MSADVKTQFSIKVHIHRKMLSRDKSSKISEIFGVTIGIVELISSGILLGFSLYNNYEFCTSATQVIVMQSCSIFDFIKVNELLLIPNIFASFIWIYVAKNVCLIH